MSSRARILIVDDDVPLARLLSLTLERTGIYETRVENRPGEALKTARDFKADLILLDVDMPGKDGGEVACDIRAQLGQVPILFLTALMPRHEGSLRDVVKGQKRMLGKPVNPVVLLSVIEHLLGNEVAA